MTSNYIKKIELCKEKQYTITTFSQDINIQLGEDKCANLLIEKGKIIQNLEPISINGLTITPAKDGDYYNYLETDEDISYNGPINNERVTKEYINCTRKRWNSQLSDFNKLVAHNALAVFFIQVLHILTKKYTVTRHYIFWCAWEPTSKNLP